MFTFATALPSVDLATAIAYHPLTLPSTARVAAAIALMNQGRDICDFTGEVDTELQLSLAQARQSCVLVLDNHQLVGIVTEHDLVCLSATNQDPAEVAIANVMASPVVTLKASEFTDLFVPLALFQRHQIHHLPLIDDDGQLIGLLTHNSLRQLLRPIDLLQWRVASEVMNPQVVCAAATASIAELTQLMMDHHVSSVVIVEDAFPLAAHELRSPLSSAIQRLRPIGIVTERDIVQFLALALNFQTLQAQTVMSTPVFSIRSDTSLWSVQTMMQQHQINRLVVTDSEGWLQGIVTQTHLLNVLNPKEIFSLVETLKQKVSRLEAENLTLLQSRNTELERQVQERTAALQARFDRERFLADTASQIRASLNLQDVLNTTVTTTRSFLQCDRLLIYQFQPDWNGTVVAESVGEGWRPALGDAIDDPCFRDQVATLHTNGKSIAIDNIHTVDYPACYLSWLEHYQVKAYLVVPILVAGQLWGLLIGHQCAHYGAWQNADLTLLNDIGIQLAVAIQQAMTHQQLQAELRARQQAEAALRESELELRSLFAAMQDVVLVLDHEGTYLKIPSTSSNLLYRASDELLGRSLQDFFPAEQVEFFLSHIRQALATGHPQECEYCLLIGETERWFNAKLSPLTTDKVLWVARDITDQQAALRDREQAELELQQQQALLRTVIDTTPNRIFVKDWEGRFLLVNQAIAASYHTTPDALLGKTGADFYVDPATVAQFARENQEIITRQTSQFIPEEKSVSIDGDELWFQWQKHPIALPGKNSLAVLGVGVDITSHKQTQTTLRQYERVVSATNDGVALLDHNYIYRLVNHVYLEWHEKSHEEMVHHSVAELLGETVFQELVKPRLDRCLAGEVQQYEDWFDYPSSRRFVRVSYSPYLELDGSITGVVITTHDLTAIKQAETLLEIQKIILEQIARGEALPGILEALICFMEEQLKQAHCSILLCDVEGRLHHGAAPHLPLTYIQAVDGVMIGEGVGSCGTAAFRRETVIASDIATDPLWQDFRDITLSHGLAACWSTPIIASDGRILGTFGVYHPKPYTPSEYDLAVVALATNIAGIAIEREQATHALEQLNQELETKVVERTAALQASEERWQLALKGANDGIWDWDLQNNTMFFSTRWKQMRGFAEDEISNSPNECISRIHPEDYDRVAAAVADHCAGKTEFFEAKYRTQCKDGSYMWVLDRAQALRDTSGQAIRISGSETDITQRIQAEAELAKSRQQYYALLQSVNGVVWEYDLRTDRFTFVSNKAEELLGYPLENWLTETHFWSNHIYEADRAAAESLFEQIVCDQRSLELEYRMVAADGSLVWVYDISTINVDENGELTTYSGVLIDIRDRKQTELALQESQRFIQQIADASPNILYLYDLQEQRNIYVNREISNILGYSPETIQSMGKNFTQALMHPDDVETVLATYHDRFSVAQDGEIIETEYRMRHANQEWRWLYSRDVVFKRTADGQAQQVIGTAQDVTDRKRLEQEQNRLIAVLEASTDYISMSDLSGNIIWNNTALKQICGLEHETPLRQRQIGDYHPQWATDLILQEGLPTAIANGSWVGETALLDATGQEIPISQLILAHKSPQGEVEFLSTIARDMRIRREYEQRLERTNAELLRATRLKDEFLATMSHELRTPLNAILGMSECLLEEILGSLNDSQKKAIATVERSGQHLLGLINDILELSKIEAGKLELNITKVSVAQLCKSSLDFVKQQAFKKQIQLNVILPPNLGDMALDERRIRQVLINLLTNAVKFTPTGGQVTVHIDLEPITINLAERVPTTRVTSLSEVPAPDNGWVLENKYYLCISVHDTGIGIAAADQAKLFQPFIQLDSSLNRQYEGTGLGLVLVKRIVELHGGDVSFESELGQGSCFTVRLPCISYMPAHPLASQTSLPQEEQSGVNPVSLTTIALPPMAALPLILLVEDNKANINTISSYLGAKGYRILVATTGEEAIALTQTQHPDLILMDIQMPGMDGLEATRQIRLDPTTKHIPIVALTALAMTGDREKCLEAGANDYITKPVKLKELSIMIQTLLESSG